MNLSPVSSAKCGSSDFSIERILSEDSSREGGDDAPSWLCCTRYQPPRLPRASNTSRARRSGRHARVPFTGAQAAALEAAYARAPYLAPPALRALAAALQLRDDRVSRYPLEWTSFTGAQAAALEAAYARAPYLAPPALRALAAALQLRDDRVSRYPLEWTSFTGAQAAALEAAYARAPYLAPPALRALAAALQLRDDRVSRYPLEWTSFTGAQAAALEAAYVRAPYMAPPALRALATALQPRDDRIKIWFQNRRARERREKSGSITPPRAVTLPSTTPVQTTSNNVWIPVNNQALHTAFHMRQNGVNDFTEEMVNSSFNVRSEVNNFGESNTSGANSHLGQTYSSASDDSSGSRCESPLDVETVD